MYYSTAFQVHSMPLPIAVASNVYPSNRYESRGGTGNVTQKQWHSRKTTVMGKRRSQHMIDILLVLDVAAPILETMATGLTYLS